MSAVVAESGPDGGAVWHYCDPLGEQRALARGEASVDLRHRPVFAVSGPDRLTWLNSLASQKLDALAPGEHTTAMLLDLQGRILHAFGGIDDGETFWAHTEPGRADALVGFLNSMRFRSLVEVRDASAERALIVTPAGPRVVERDQIEAELGECRAGTWASEACLLYTSPSPRD